MAVFVSLPLFIKRGMGAGAWAGGGEDSVSVRTETSAASPHSRLCQLEMSLEWHKEINAVFCERRGQAGYDCLFFLPNRWSLMLTHKCCFIRSSPFHHSVSCYLSIYLSFFYLSFNNLPSLSYSVTVAVTFSEETPHAQFLLYIQTQVLI